MTNATTRGARRVGAGPGERRVGARLLLAVVLVVAAIGVAIALAVVSSGDDGPNATASALQDNAARFSRAVSRPVVLGIASGRLLAAIASRTYHDVAAGGIATGIAQIGAGRSGPVVALTFQVSVTGESHLNQGSVDRASYLAHFDRHGLISGYPRLIAPSELLQPLSPRSFVPPP